MPVGEDVAPGTEEDCAAVWGERADGVGIGMPGQSRRDASSYGHDVDIGIAVVLSVERNPLAVGGKDGTGLDPLVGCQPARMRAVHIRHPQIVGVDERDVVTTDGRLAEEFCAGGVDRSGHGRRENERREGNDRKETSEVHEFLRFEAGWVWQKHRKVRTMADDSTTASIR